MLCAFPRSILAMEPPATTEQPAQTTPSKEETKWVRAVEPKALSQSVQRGLAWIVATQLENGGWSQGAESVNLGKGMAPLKAKPNVADTCISSLALMRAGSTPRSGPHSSSISKAVNFICAQIEESDSTSLSVTNIKGTRVQAKLGPYVDTFLAALVLV